MSLDGKALRFVCGGLVLFAAGAAHGASPAPIRGEDGMVVSASGLASDVGLAVLRDGGNAIDAAVAVGFDSASFSAEAEAAEEAFVTSVEDSAIVRF